MHYEQHINNLGKPEITPKQERLCQNCNMNKVEDELHYLLECPKHKVKHHSFLNCYFEIYPNLKTLNNEQLYIWIMSNEETTFVNSLCIFLKSAVDKQKSE